VKIVTFKVEEALLRKIDEIARIEGVSRSEVIREALSVYVTRNRRGERIRKGIRVRHVILT